MKAVLIPNETPTVPAAAANRSGTGSSLRKAVAFIWKYLVGASLTQTAFGSIFLFGWLFRASQRVIFKKWWEASDAGKSKKWSEFAMQDSATLQHQHWPNWIVAQNSGLWKTIRDPNGDRRLKRTWKMLWASLKANFVIGAQGLFNTCVLTLPGCTLMAFAWYAGWLNSFNKGYEHAPVGPALWMAGALLFCAAMFYVPMAQMRHASTGNWKSFYQFKLVWRIVRKAWAPSIGLAGMYALVSLPFMVMKIVPYFFPQISPSLADATPRRAYEISQAYFFWCGVVLFPALLLLRLAAARIYASTLLGLVRSGSIAEYELGDAEWVTLHRLNLLQASPPAERHYLLKAAGWFGTRMGRAVSAILLVLIWFSFVAQILISEFIIKTEPGWMNQPLVQFPMFNYTPTQLKEGKENI